MVIDDETRNVAKALAKANGYSEDYKLDVGGGFNVPHWLTFVSEATQLIKNKRALGK